MTTTPTPEALRHRAAARRWALAGEWGFTAASSAVNVTVITAAGGTLLRILLAGLAPVVLAAMSRLITKVLQAELVVSGTADRVNWAVAGAVGVIGAGAFYLSFETLRRAAEPDHGGMAWVFPATLDLAIVVCAVVLAVIARADETDQRNGVPPRATTWTRLTARFSGDRDTASVTRHVAADHRAADPDLELTSPDSLTWLAAPPARHDADQEPNHDARQKAAPQPVSSDDSVTRQPDAQVDDAVTEPLTLPADTSEDQSDDAGQTGSVTRIADSDRDADGTPASGRVARASDAPVARRLTSVPTVQAGDADAELILRLIAEGASGTDVAAALGVSKSTALRRMREVRKAADESNPEPALA